jgi:DNA polymerase-3 subunit alpha
LDGAARLQDLVTRAAELNMNALAITDHGNLFGAVEFYQECSKANIKPIIGCEAYIAPSARDFRQKIEGERSSYHLVLLAKNQTGFKNLIKLSSIAYLEGMYYKPRIDFELLKKYSEGLIATSACMSGQIAWKLRNGQRKEAIKTAEQYIELFGDDFYFEIQDHGIPEEQKVYPQVYNLAQEMGVKVVATNDTHYLNFGDDAAHDILICLQTAADRDDPNRMRYGTDQLYMKSPEEMYRLFKDRPNVLENTLEVAEKVNLQLDFEARHLPRFSIPESEGKINEDEYLKSLAYQGAKKKFPDLSKEITERIDYELNVIKKMGFAGYFLITQDFIHAAKEKDIPVGIGRGSAAGSMVAYALDITDINPLKYDLLFERFLNPDRISMPDIDIDFCVERRDEVIEYVREKYGRRNVAQIITFGTMASRGVIRDVSRILKIPIPQADAIAKMVPMEAAKPLPLERAFKEVPELKEIAESDDIRMQELVKFSKTLEGIARHASVHAAGIIIAPEEVSEYAPLYKTVEGEITTQWSMSSCEAMGLLKMDFLGLRNLTVIQKTEKMIRERHDKNFTMHNIPLDDPQTFRLFGEALTVGVFQFESSGMQEYIKKLKPSRIEDLIAMNALYRPGPMEMINDFIDRKYGRKKIEYLHPLLEPILSETYGIIVYQEQVMRIASDLSGFTLAQADLMRRAMGKKKAEVMQQQKDRFVNGCLDKGIDEKTASTIFDLIEKFAQYGFNKSHSAAYALIAYQTAYLKAHFTAEFMAANLTSELSSLPRVMILMDECRKLGLTIKAPDVNTSVANFMPQDDKTIMFGMGAIKNVGPNAINNLVKAREEGGKFSSIFDLVKRVDLRLVNKKVLESLANAGALDSMNGTRSQLYNSVETAIEFGSNVQSEMKDKNQIGLFDLGSNGQIEHLKEPDLPDISDWSLTEKLKKERELLGFYISGHPLDPYRPLISLYTTKFSFPQNGDGDLKSELPKYVKICGQVSEVKTLFDRKQQKMAFVKMEDFDKSYEIVIFGSLFPKCEIFVKQDAILFIQGKLNSGPDDNLVKLMAEAVYEVESVPELLTDSVILSVNRQNLNEELLRQLKMTIQSSPGSLPVYFMFDFNGTGNIHMRSSQMGLNMSQSTLKQLCTLLGAENVQVKLRDAQ